MEQENTTNVCDFDTLLEQKSRTRLGSIYVASGRHKQSSTDVFTAKDVITNVARTMKAIQNADCVRIDRNARMKLAQYKNSQFLSDHDPLTTAAKFDTQFASNTQLIDVIEKAEDMHVAGGMTQEFEIMFCDPLEIIDSDLKIERDKTAMQQAIGDDINVIKYTNPETKLLLTEQTGDVVITNMSQSKQVLDNRQLKDDPVLLLRNRTEKLNESNDLDLGRLGVIIEDKVERSVSPVLKMNVQSKKPVISQHLTVDLELFEQFERNAANLLTSENVDLNTAEDVLSAQILKTEVGPPLKIEEQSPEEEQSSLIIETKYFRKEDRKNKNKCIQEEEFEPSQILMGKRTMPLENKDQIEASSESEQKMLTNLSEEPEQRDKSKTNECEDFPNLEYDFDKHGSTTPVLRPPSVASEDKFADEILFSSDEESDYVHKNAQELPLSIALETSFYTNLSDVLDTTMYVGFQTASNKSIQIRTESYDKAKHSLEAVSLIDLVKKCSSKEQVQDNTADNISSKGALLNDIYKAVEEKATNNVAHIDFKTDRCKNINISTEAMLNSSVLFKDLDNQQQEVDESTDIEIVDKFQNKHINDKRDILEKSNGLFNDTDGEMFNTEMTMKPCHDASKICVISNSLKNTPIPTIHKFEGFKTASNKNINISKKSLEICRKVFHDIDNVDDENATDFSNTREVAMLQAQGASTNCDSEVTSLTNKKNMQCSQKALSIIDDFFLARCDMKESSQNKFKRQCDNITEDIIQMVEDPGFVGLKMTSDKYINISKDAIARTVSVLKHLDVNPTCINDKTECLKTGSFCGFKTASNKNILVSDGALAETKRVFKDINDLIYESSDDVSSFECFQTAGNKPFIESKETLERSKSAFQDFHGINTTFVTKQCAKHSEPKFVGFQTASNKPVHVSKEALDKSRNMIKYKKPVPVSKQALEKTKNIFRDNKPLEIVTGDQTLTSKPEFIGFQTNINKQVSIEALENENLFDKPKPEMQLVGFQTASKNPVTISKKALERSKTIFRDIDKYEETDQYLGFRTASNKRIKVSEDSVEKVKKLFQDMPDLMDNIIPKEATHNELPTSCTLIKRDSRDAKNLFQDLKCDVAERGETSKFCGFQTASNKAVKISAEAMAKTRNIFQDIDLDINNTNVPNKVEGYNTASNKKVEVSKDDFGFCKEILDKSFKSEVKKTNFIGFQTASEKEVVISEDALAKTKEIFKDLEMSQTIPPKIATPYILIKRDSRDAKNLFQDLKCDVAERGETSKFCGFQTASNKAVKISAEAMAKTRNIFQDIDLDINNTNVPNKFEGYNTASNKKVEVSNDAFGFCKEILDKSFKSEVKKTNFIGFQTASEKKVVISEDALAKTKEIFKDLEMSQTIPPKFATSLGYETGNNVEVLASNETPIKLKSATSNITDVKPVKVNIAETYPEPSKPSPHVKEIELHTIINTQLLHNFEESMNTEDFCPKSPSFSRKRSGSPILSCPKAKKRKTFKAPYKQSPTIERLTKDRTNVSKKHCTTVKFEENYKKQKCHTLKTVQELEKDSKAKSDTDPYILQFNFNELLQFQFVGDRNNLTPSESLSIDELKVHFEESVSKKIIPTGWLENHMRLILWKLISYEIRFPNTMSGICNAKAVIDQLKYRYDRELYIVERPVLRKILERDDVSTRLMVLCVVSILADGQDGISVPSANCTVELLLTDGWYCLKASTDRMLARLVSERKITVGCKLAICGAELVNCDQGMSPWEDTSKVRLKLAGNSTRRARWDARLGRHGNAAILSQLSCACADGGKLARTRVLVARVYPLLYVEKFEDGSTVTRSERLEQLYQMRYESDRQAQLERLYEDIEREFSDVDSQESSDAELCSGKRRYLESGSQIAKMVKKSNDPAEFKSTLTESQHRMLDDHSAKTREKLLEAIQARVQEKLDAAGLDTKRNVVSLLKIRVAGVGERNGAMEVTKGFMSIWRPNDAILEILQEGAWVDVMDVVPTGMRYSEIQLSAGRQSTFDKAKLKETPKLKAVSEALSRTCFRIEELTRNPNSNHDYNEIDSVGVVFEIEPSKTDFEKESVRNRHLFQNVYLADEEKNVVCVNFWGGLKKFGFENILDTGQVVYAANLQKRAGNTRKYIPQYRATEFTYFTKTPKSVKAKDLVVELVKRLNGLDRRKFFQECVEKRNAVPSKCQGNTENVSPYKFNNTDYNLSKNKIYIESPLVRKPANEDLNLTGLDFESTFKHKETQDMSPEELKRKQRVRQKMAKLKMYGEPPPISPIHIINKSVNARRHYQSPLASKLPDESPKTTARTRNYQNGVGVARFPNEILPVSVEKKMESMDVTSPLVSMNRTYVKHVNPVKINFSDRTCENDSPLVDHFAEEFDDSPPLSLD